MDETTHTSFGLDALPRQLAEARPATSHIALQYVEPPRPSRWQRFLAFLGLADG